MQRNLHSINDKQPEVELFAPCKIGDGIVILDPNSANSLREKFFLSKITKTFFIPASGSGSRMFEFLFDFLEEPTEENRSAVERFLNHVEDFAFFYQLPAQVQEQLRERTMDIEQFVSYILNNNGMGLAHLPKGLIPFHKYGPFLLNPFHEHVLQGLAATNDSCSFHFTIQTKFESAIQEQLNFLTGLTGKQLNIDFSIQNPQSDTQTYYTDGTPVIKENGENLVRPAGHGALLENLQRIDSDLIFIKNIDNVQHLEDSETAIETIQTIGGLNLYIQEKIQAILSNPTLDAIKELNEEFALFHESELNKSLDDLIDLLKRPLRVCGMVRNEGQPGGGPFWIKDDDSITKQIVEKAQINLRGDQYRVMIQSTHFNPVFMACQGKMYDGSKIDFEKYCDVSKYFIVNKRYQGKPIRFIELPGLWNGSMAFWNTVFVEIKSEAFSPVKTILDLLNPAH